MTFHPGARAPLFALLVASTSVMAVQTASAQAPRPISIGQTVQGELSTRDPKLPDESHYDDYRVSLRAGEGVTITLSSDAFDTLVSIGQGRDEDYEAIKSNDDDGGGTNSRLNFRAETAGEYSIRANSLSGGQTGAYTLALTARPPSAPVKTASLGIGDRDVTANGSLADGGARVEDESDQLFDNYTLSLREGTSVLLKMTSEFDNRLRLTRTGPDGVEEVASDDDSGGDLDAQLVWRVDRTGNYTLRAEAIDADGAGDYTITTRTLPNAPERLPRPVGLRKGQSVNGELRFGDAVADPYNLFDLYEISGRGGETVTIRVKTSADGGFDSMVAVGANVAGQFALLEENDDADYGEAGAPDGENPLNAGLTFTFKESGRVLVRVRALQDAKTGPYTVSVE